MNSPVRPLIGLFDSGVGGLSVLQALHRQLPGNNLLYIADSGHAPYGERSDAFIHERTHRVAEHLLAEGATVLVLACNTATAVAATSLRARWPTVPIVAVEPGIKPAVGITRNRRIGIMATPATLRSERVRKLIDAHAKGCDVHMQPCPGLAGQIEQGDADAPGLLELIETFSAPLRAAGVDTVVLGCTHYAFVAAHIQAALGPDVTLVDTAEAVARQAARVADPAAPSSVPSPSGRVRLLTSGDEHVLARVARHWLPFPCEISHTPV